MFSWPAPRNLDQIRAAKAEQSTESLTLPRSGCTWARVENGPHHGGSSCQGCQVSIAANRAGA